jgi:hypothetical protein
MHRGRSKATVMPLTWTITANRQGFK